MAKSLIELANSEKQDTFIKLEDLSVPFSKYICEHLKINDKQITSKSSTFLDTCRQYNNSEIGLDTLISSTKKLGFVNVLDAFHIVSNEDIPTKFFEVQKIGKDKGIVLTDNFFALTESKQFVNFNYEVEARWRLVETAWSLNINPSLLVVNYDKEENLFFINEDLKNRRINITSSRDSLNGYQKGKCFYCFDDISIEKLSENLADVDHFFPHVLQREVNTNLTGVWNLVLACKTCNRGVSGKFERIPERKYLERLHKRNEFFIESHHPLRETLINQTGKLQKQRINFLQTMYQEARNNIVSTCWKPITEYEPAF